MNMGDIPPLACDEIDGLVDWEELEEESSRRRWIESRGEQMSCPQNARYSPRIFTAMLASTNGRVEPLIQELHVQAMRRESV